MTNISAKVWSKNIPEECYLNIDLQEMIQFGETVQWGVFYFSSKSHFQNPIIILPYINTF